MADTKTCIKCGTPKKVDEFYMMRTGERDNMCKKCLTMRVDPFDPETFKWLLERYDVPYIKHQWDKLLNNAYLKAGNDIRKISGMAIFGKYLGTMKINQYKDLHWADTERIELEQINKEAALEIERKKLDEEYKIMYENGEINESQYRTLTSTPSQHKQDLEIYNIDIDAERAGKAGDVSTAGPVQYMDEMDLPDPAAELTEDDKIYLAMKWGRYYTPQEWVELETFYTDMTNSFDIQDADSIKILKMICKTTLKMDQALDSNDFDSYNKLARVLDSQRKSAKFTAAQNKDEKSQFVDSVGELVAYCEKEGGIIPRFEITAPQDIVDEILEDNKRYLNSLVKEDTALAQQIENYIKRKEAAEQAKKDKEEAKAKGLDYVEVTDEDMIARMEQVEDEIEWNAKIMRGEAD